MWRQSSGHVKPLTWINPQCYFCLPGTYWFHSPASTCYTNVIDHEYIIITYFSHCIQWYMLFFFLLITMSIVKYFCWLFSWLSLLKRGRTLFNESYLWIKTVNWNREDKSCKILTDTVLHDTTLMAIPTWNKFLTKTTCDTCNISDLISFSLVKCMSQKNP